MIGRLYSVPACYLSNNFPVITFSKYENIRKTKTKTEHFGLCRNPGQYVYKKKKEQRTHGHSTNMISVLLQKSKDILKND